MAGQSSWSTSVLNRVVFAAPADAELTPAPIPEHWIIEGAPQVRSKRLATCPDGAAAAIVWACTGGRFHWHYAVDEFLYIISGEVFVTDEKEVSRRLGPGDMAFFPAGGSSIWHVPHEVKKLAICKHHMPRPFAFALRVWTKLFRIFDADAESAALDSAPEPNGERAGVPAA